ncbi:MAG: hypothetical protein A3F83_06855 [Candidatus Glassbacteria bacterium RIFCSPLOWO2_12_FULL_58_11]|uniref:Uncharacterized protein n=1 Tax=Candidatus Glassbacteria bacterium RIFCSPLOWO2_12_FULL_58_11 TaxID=1817867 RepID=A0A1F5Z2T3_9BACT|nr:MAG: hypothetical protein A3F83_06855 [Candidatus Glassbacteria bacterium RIFCSPLOWO2_12_FULL_58_11]
MNCCNLHRQSASGNPAGRRNWRWNVLLPAFLLALAGCSAKAPTELPVDFSYDGSYVLVWVSTTRDQSNDVAFDRNAATGLLLISADHYELNASFGSAAFGYGSRTGSGQVSLGDGYVDFIADSVDTQTVPRGVYDLEKEQLKINYVKADWLWTEIWQKAAPVDFPTGG